MDQLNFFVYIGESRISTPLYLIEPRMSTAFPTDRISVTMGTLKLGKLFWKKHPEQAILAPKTLLFR